MSTPATPSGAWAAATRSTSSYTAWTAVKRSPKGARRAPASAMAWGSRSMPTTCSPGKRVRASSLCPPMPRVASTRTAPGRSTAGARRSRHRCASTGTWRSAALRSFSVSALTSSVLLVRPARGATEAVGGPPPPDQDSRRRALAPGKCVRVAVRDLVVRRSGRSEESGDHLLRRVGEGVLGGGEVLLPRGGGPDLHPGAGADHREVPLEARVGAQVGRDGDAALLVGLLVGRAGEEDTRVVPHAPVGDRCFAQLLMDLLELPHRVQRETAFLPLGEHQSARELVAELRRKDESPLVVQTRVVGAEEHAGHHPSPNH